MADTEVEKEAILLRVAGRHPRYGAQNVYGGNQAECDELEGILSSRLARLDLNF